MALTRLTSATAPVQFFFSKDVKIFPSTYRGFYESLGEGSDEKISVVFDPESRLVSEYNYTHLLGMQKGLSSYIVEFNKDILRCIIDGYYFEILGTDEEGLGNCLDSGLNLYELLTNPNYTDISLCICTRKSSLNQAEGNLDNPRHLTYLASQYVGCNSLDQCMNGSDIFYCTALAVKLSKDLSSAASYYTTSSANTTQHELQLKVDGKICYKNFLNNHINIYSENLSNVNLNPNTPEYSFGDINLELGYEAVARGVGAIAIGSGSEATLISEESTNGKSIYIPSDYSIAIGSLAKSTQEFAIALGQGASAEGTGSIAIGAAKDASSTESVGEDSLALGRKAKAESLKAIAIGSNAIASEEAVIAIGASAKAEDQYAVALGHSAQATESNTTAIGTSSEASGSNTTAIGTLSKATGSNAIALGDQTQAVAENTIAVGAQSKAEANCAMAVGTNAQATAKDAVVVGAGAKGTAESSTALGKDAESLNTSATALGHDAKAAGQNSIALGKSAQALATDSIVISTGAKTEKSGSIVIGTLAPSTTVKSENTVHLGNGISPLAQASSCIIGNFNDPNKSGQVVIATGTDASHKRTSCTFGGADGTTLYESLAVQGSANITQNLVLGKDLTVNKNLTVNANTTLANDLSVNIGGDKSVKFNLRAAGSPNAVLEVSHSNAQDFTTTDTTTNLSLADESLNLKAEKTIEERGAGASPKKTSTAQIDFSFDAAGSSCLDIEADKINISANTLLNLKYAQGEASLLQLVFDMAHPIDSIFHTVDQNLNKAAAVADYFKTKYGIDSTWEAWGQGRVPLGASGTKYVPGSAGHGGSETATLKTTELPSHAHTISCESTSLGPFSHKINDQAKTDEGWTLTTDKSGGHSHNIPQSGAHVHAVKTDRGTSGDKEECFGLNNQAGSWRIWEFADKTDETGNKGNEFGGAQAAHFGEHGHTADAAGAHTHTIRLNIADHAKVSHNHTVNCDNAGEGKSFSIMQPYQVCYMWKRIS